MKKFLFLIVCFAISLSVSAKDNNAAETKETQNADFIRDFDMVVENPTNLELAEKLIKYEDTPAAIAQWLIEEIINKHFPAEDDSDDFNWVDISNFSSTEREIYKAIIDIAAMGIKYDNDRSGNPTKGSLLSIMSTILRSDPTETATADKYLNEIEKMFKRDKKSDFNNLKVLVIYNRAFIAGHGMDNPKAAFDILDKNLKTVIRLEPSLDIKLMYWRYLRSTAKALGKTAAVRRCDVVIAKTKEEMDQLSADIEAEENSTYYDNYTQPDDADAPVTQIMIIDNKNQ